MRAWWWLLVTAHFVCGNPESVEDLYESGINPNNNEENLREEDIHTNPIYKPKIIFTRRKRSPDDEERVKKQPKFHSWGGKRYGDEEDDNGNNFDLDHTAKHYEINHENLLTYFLIPFSTNISYLERDTADKGDVEALSKRAKQSPAFSSWGGKRDPEIVRDLMKRSDLYNSILQQNSFRPSQSEQNWKRYPAFNSWAGKRAAAFNSWGGKRVSSFNSWAGKRTNFENTESENEFNKAIGNTSINQTPTFRSSEANVEQDDPLSDFNVNNEDTVNDVSKDKTTLSSWGRTEEPEIESFNEKRAFNSWGGKRAAAFNSWGGKRAAAFNSWGGKRVPSFNSWAGKRAAAFNSWGGKRAAAFNSWGGKRAAPFNSWAGKRAAAFNSWGGKRAAAFNSWGGKRVPSFNSWGGKKAAAFNSWGGKRAAAFNSWGGKRAAAFNSWGGKRAAAFNNRGGTLDENLPTSSKQNVQFLEQGNELNEAPDDFNMQTMEELYERNENDNQRNNFMREGSTKGHFDREPTAYNDNKFPNIVSDEHQPVFLGFAEKRNAHKNLVEKKASPAFSSWAGKRSPIFSAWYGNKIPTVQLSSGKRRPAFSSWGGKRSGSEKRFEQYSLDCSPSNREQEGRNCPEAVEVDSGEPDKNIQSPEEKNFTRKKRGVDCDTEGNNISEMYGEESCRVKKFYKNEKKNKVLTRMLLQGGLTWPMAMKTIPKVVDFYAWGGKRSL